MTTALVRPLALLCLPLLGALAIFVIARRPRQLYAWALAGILVGFFVFYAGDIILFQPNLLPEIGFLWQRIQIFAAWGAIFSAMVLALALHQTPLVGWEKASALVIIGRGIIDVLWIASINPYTEGGCASLATGHPQLYCGWASRPAIAATVVCILLLVLLFWRAAFVATGRFRKVLQRYLWLAILCAVSAGMVNNIAGFFHVLLPPSEIPTLLGAIVATRMVLILEQQEARLPSGHWSTALFVWLLLLVAAAVADTQWLALPAPVLTLLVLAGGGAVGAAWVLPQLGTANTVLSQDPPDFPTRHSTSEQAAATSAPDPVLLADENTRPIMASLRVKLCGVMAVYRQDELLPNTTDVWRSHKARSLLALLALGGERGALDVDLVDALWPPDDALSAHEERKALSTLRSYVSTLRKVLEPDGPRGSERFIAREEGRYRLVPDEIWVDIWAFEAEASRAQQFARQGLREEAFAVLASGHRAASPGRPASG